MSEAICAGDTVKLKSGSPLMVVLEVTDSGCLCQWFDDKNNPMEQNFKTVVLEKASKSTTSGAFFTVTRG